MEANEEAKTLLEGKKIIKVYLHSSKESMRETGEDADLTEAQLNRFIYALYEVEFDLLVDKKGNVEITKVNGQELKDK